MNHITASASAYAMSALDVNGERVQAGGGFTSDEVEGPEEIEEPSKAAIDEAVSFAKANPLPELGDLYTHVFVG